MESRFSTVQNYIGLKPRQSHKIFWICLSAEHIEHHALLTKHIEINMFFYFAREASDDFIAGVI